jgi:hypothetical protein
MYGMLFLLQNFFPLLQVPEYIGMNATIATLKKIAMSKYYR